MRDFIKRYQKTITFALVVLLVLASIFIYRHIRRISGKYEPSVGTVVKEVQHYEDNEYVVYQMNKVDVYTSYYKDFMQLLVNDPSKAYNKLTDDSKASMFNNDYDKFVKFYKSIDKSLLLSSTIDRYNDEKKGKIIIVDSTESTYVFYENGAWNYKVDLMNRISL